MEYSNRKNITSQIYPGKKIRISSSDKIKKIFGSLDHCTRTNEVVKYAGKILTFSHLDGKKVYVKENIGVTFHIDLIEFLTLLPDELFEL